MEHIGNWYSINLKQPGFLSDKDYQDYIIFKLFQYVKVIDVSLIDPLYYHIDALFDSEDCAESFCKENGEFVQSINRSIDREIITKRTYIEKESFTNE